MNTVMHKGMEVFDQLSPDEQLVAMAWNVIRARIEGLPQDDQNELFELAMEIPKAESVEDRQSIWLAMREIVAQRPVKVRKLPPSGAPLAPRSKAWAEYIGKKINDLRKKRNWTQAELAKASGLPQSHISR